MDHLRHAINGHGAVVLDVEEVKIARHLGDEQTPVRKESHCPGIVELHDFLNSEGEARGCGGRIRLGYNPVRLSFLTIKSEQKPNRNGEPDHLKKTNQGINQPSKIK